MDNIRSSIFLLFCKRSGNLIIQSHFGNPDSRLDIKFDSAWFISHFRSQYNIYTNDQIRAIYAILSSKWIKEPGKLDINNKSIFFLLCHFTEEVLIEKNNSPICKYEHLLRWREISGLIGEDLFTTSFLALKDLRNNRSRNQFTWQPIITHDNPAIKKITDKGIAELHFHLRGSSLNFDINWLSLMNSIVKRSNDFKLIEDKLQSPEISTSINTKEISLHALVIKACAIRLFIFKSLQSGTVCPSELFKLENILRIPNFLELLNATNTLQFQINSAKRVFGKRYSNQIVDYAIPANLTQTELTQSDLYTNSILSGERWIMYHMFRKVYSDEVEFKSLSTLFYAYIAIKGRIRTELVQLNDRIGFDNFGQYERRKDQFIKEGSIYDDLITHLAINATFQNQSIEYLEARITPKLDSYLTTKAIQKTDNQINDKRFKFNSSSSKSNDKHFYILHYIKDGTKSSSFESEYPVPRSNFLRHRIKRQTFAIALTRKKNPKVSQRIAGIDAANTEIGCRPEVFGQAYRYLKNQPNINRFEYLANTQLYDLGFTYHVGEDYYDLVDGLRAIDEAILFLNLTRGDRLGHALALGIDSNHYYSLCNKTLVMPKQDFLDNVAWLLVKSKELNITINSSLSHLLDCWFEQYFNYIYNEIDHKPTIQTYYQSWLLRGDNPLNYINPSIEPKMIDLGHWQKYDLNNFNQNIKNARVNQDARCLYNAYHFNTSAKQRGSETDEYSITYDYIALVYQLQKAMREKIARLHLCIETNPSSNKVISTSRLYCTHPITKFYNYDLELNEGLIKECPQISVSINTDDQGIFSTSIENEFSLMALALEKQQNDDKTLRYSPRMIYKWLDNIRELAFEQRFRKDDKIITEHIINDKNDLI